MKVAVVGARTYLNDLIENTLTNGGYLVHSSIYVSSEDHTITPVADIDFQDIVQCERFFDNVDCVIHTGLNCRKRSDKNIYDQIASLSCIVNEALSRNIRMVYVSDALAGGYHSNVAYHTEQESWNQSIEWSLYGHMYHMSERVLYRGIAEGLQALVVRPAVMIGHPDDREALALLSAILRRNRSESKDGLCITSRSDVVAIIQAWLERDHHPHNLIIAGGQNITLGDFSKYLMAGSNLSVSLWTYILSIFFTKSYSFLGRPMDLRLYYDSQKSIRWLGVQTQDLEVTIREFL